ncbi:hypothetical protein [Paraburkholderia phenoliruptrix]|uniref:hypothetical protein n=1 Tax=Paraburkholderia phenoliruptrix TaxID=252970 RepID=UPI001C4EEEBC|nr:hypothetical protein [Paraburkholderia phenoliruptrix]MBW0450830.1 hypothetical protein [Paraburkholderia phenoliruptrix]MBW9100923.1 hypothetical protein [Paraburkholderia phenoliruptrix]
MIRFVLVLAACVLSLAACGGGSDGGAPATTAKTFKISMYGNPLVSSRVAAHAQTIASVAAAASDATPPAAAQTTVQSLQDALAARGVTATVTAQVMDGTTLHQIVMGENNGLPPTPDQFKSDPSEWILVNFQLDDMVSRVDVPTQAAAIQQFIQDLTVFTQRAAVSGKGVYAVQPIQTCDAPSGFSASSGLQYALTQALQKSGLTIVGAIPFGVSYDAFGDPIMTPDMAHLGADCRTPDDYLRNLQVQAIADRIADLYKASPAAAPSGASATGT